MNYGIRDNVPAIVLARLQGAVVHNLEVRCWRIRRSDLGVAKAYGSFC
jgi:hypothetical protein